MAESSILVDSKGPLMLNGQLCEETKRTAGVATEVDQCANEGWRLVERRMRMLLQGLMCLLG